MHTYIRRHAPCAYVCVCQHGCVRLVRPFSPPPPSLPLSRLAILSALKGHTRHRDAAADRHNGRHHAASDTHPHAHTHQAYQPARQPMFLNHLRHTFCLRGSCFVLCVFCLGYFPRPLLCLPELLSVGISNRLVAFLPHCGLIDSLTHLRACHPCVRNK